MTSATEGHTVHFDAPLACAHMRVVEVSTQQLINGDRQVPNALSGRVINRVGNGGCDADDADLPDALDAERIDGFVPLVDEDDLDVVHVCVHRDMILGDVGVHDAAEAVIDERLLVQRHADAPDHGAHDLAGGGLRVQAAAGRDRADDAVTRTTPSSLSTLTSAKTAQCVLWAFEPSSGK